MGTGRRLAFGIPNIALVSVENISRIVRIFALIGNRLFPEDVIQGMAGYACTPKAFNATCC